MQKICAKQNIKIFNKDRIQLCTCTTLTVSASLTGSCFYLVNKGGLWEKRACPGGGGGGGNMPFSKRPSHPTLL